MYDQTELVLTAVIDDFQLPPSTPISKKMRQVLTKLLLAIKFRSYSLCISLL